MLFDSVWTRHRCFDLLQAALRGGKVLHTRVRISCSLRVPARRAFSSSGMSACMHRTVELEETDVWFSLWQSDALPCLCVLQLQSFSKVRTVSMRLHDVLTWDCTDKDAYYLVP